MATPPNTTQHDTRELAKKTFYVHEVRVASKTCTSCKGIRQDRPFYVHEVRVAGKTCTSCKSKHPTKYILTN